MHNTENDNVLFTEYNLDDEADEADTRLDNVKDKSFILAPFQSFDSNCKPDAPPVAVEKAWPSKEIKRMIVSRKTIAYGIKVREINRAYE